MIDEKFLRAAVGIRRRYLEMTSDIGKYEARLKITNEKIEKALSDLDIIKQDIGKKNSNDVISRMMELVYQVEDEGKSIQAYIDPLNEGIERLAVEEAELFSQIKRSNPNLEDDDIVKNVKDRLKVEGLL